MMLLSLVLFVFVSLLLLPSMCLVNKDVYIVVRVGLLLLLVVRLMINARNRRHRHGRLIVVPVINKLNPFNLCLPASAR